MDRTRLLIKNLPDDCPSDIFNTHHGAQTFKRYGRRRGVLVFPNENLAKSALQELHQSELKGRIISVEYLNTRQNIDDKIVEEKSSSSDVIPKISKFLKSLYATDSRFGFEQPPPPYLKYCYPKINRSILDSISIALLTVPKFYVQVLHLMNRLNLDPPFLPLKKPFVPPGEPCNVQTQTDFDESSHKQKNIAVTLGTDESELESEEDENKIQTRRVERKRKNTNDYDIIKKKAKKLLASSRLVEIKQTINEPKVKYSKELFEQSGKLDLKHQKIELNVSNLKLPEIVETTNESSSQNRNEENHILDVKTIITDEELKQNKISEKQLKELPFFKNYQKGNKSNKLYIKNLAKDVTEDDLRMIYSRFVVNTNQPEDSITIKLMQFGKMKGQAFVTFNALQNNDFEIVERALNETNGYILKNKPMVVCFGKNK